jgi:hypothetical protein
MKRLRLQALVQPSIKVKVLIRAEILLEADVVWDQADDLPDLLAVHTVSDLIIGYPRLPACLRDKTCEHANGSRLSSTVRPEKAKYLSFIDTEGQILNGRDISVCSREVVRFDQCLPPRVRI